MRRPHVVPRGYQRLWCAEPERERLLVIEKSTRTARLQGTRDTFVSPGFLSVRLADGTVTDGAEDAFGIVENIILPALRDISLTHFSASHDMAIKTAFAMLWARSYASELVRERVHAEVVVDQKSRQAADPRLRAAFEQQHGRPPTQIEIDQLVETNARRLWTSRELHVTKMVEYHNRSLDHFRSLFTSLYVAPTHLEFVTSDNPVVLARGDAMIHVGAHNRIALEDADRLILPLGRRYAACLTTEPEGLGVLDPSHVYEINNATWRNAIRYVACHPEVDPVALCAVSERRPETDVSVSIGTAPSRWEASLCHHRHTGTPSN